MTKSDPSKPASNKQRKLTRIFAMLAGSLLVGCASPKHTADEYREMGWQAALSGDAAQSTAYAKKSIAMAPKSQWNRVGYGWCLFDLALYPEALAQWQKAYKRDQESCRINVCLALAYYKTGREKEALHFYSKQVEIDGDFGRWSSLLETTHHWQPNEKIVLHAIYKKWRASQAGK